MKTKLSILLCIALATTACDKSEVETTASGSTEAAPSCADGSSPSVHYYDGDGDGYGDTSRFRVICVGDETWIKRGQDCADDNADVNPGVAEALDARDNNCDGSIDEGFDLYSDVNNCGSIGNACSFANGSASCVNGGCSLTACNAGYFNTNSDSSDGCEDSTPRASAGDIVITEIMANPDGVQDTDGEYVEIYNASASDLNLQGMVIRDNDDDSYTVRSAVILTAGSYAVIAREADPAVNGGFTPDIVVGNSFRLFNTEDEVVLELHGVTLDSVEYHADRWPMSRGESMILEPGREDATQNDDPSNWCTSTNAWFRGDKGSPGAANDRC